MLLSPLSFCSEGEKKRSDGKSKSTRFSGTDNSAATYFNHYHLLPVWFPRKRRKMNELNGYFRIPHNSFISP